MSKKEIPVKNNSVKKQNHTEKNLWKNKDTIPLSQDYKDSTLAGWYPPGNLESSTDDAFVELGWGKIIFAHTFSSHQKLIEILSDEKKGQRNIAFYLREPHVILSKAPQEIFLDPSHSYRLWLEESQKLENSSEEGFIIKEVDTIEECRFINEIYKKNHMVEPPPEYILKNKKSVIIQYFIAVDRKNGNILGTITGIDHFLAFKDIEKGSSFWCLAVDPMAPFPGIGKALVLKLAGLYLKRKRAYMDLSVLHSNTQAISFYESLGFVRVPVFALKYKNAFNEPLYTGRNNEPVLNPYGDIIVTEARLRGIQVNILSQNPAMFELVFGGRSVICHESLSDQTSAIAMSYCQNKRLTARRLKEFGLRVPDQLLTVNLQEGQHFLKKHKRVVVKPVDGEQGHKVFVDLQNEKEFIKAFEEVNSGGPVLVEEFFEGDDIRVVVINGEVVAAAHRKPPEIAGTGKHDIETLIEKLNRRRIAATKGESKIPVDEETMRCLSHNGFTLKTILPKNKKLKVRRTANLHTGGILQDITDKLRRDIKETALHAAEILTIPVVGFDFMINSMTKEYCIIEANERPGLANHEPRPTAQKFIDFLFPQTITTHIDHD